MKKLYFVLLFICFSVTGIFAQTLDFEYSNGFVGKETVFVNKSVIDEEVITVAWDLTGNGVYNNGWGDTVRFVYAAIGTYTVGLRITVRSLQSYVFTKEIEIVHELNANFTSTIVCIGGTTKFTNTSTSSDVIVSTNWDFNSDGIFNDASGNSINYLFTTPGIHVVGLRIVTQSGLAMSIYRQVVVAELPTANFSTSNTCVGTYTEFTNLSVIRADDIADFIWKFGDGSAWSNVSNPIHIYSSPGIYNVTLIVNSSFGCSHTITKNVSIKPLPEFTLEFSGPTEFTEGESVTVTAIGDFDQAIWSTGAISNSIIITRGGTYTVEVSKNGCSSAKSFTIIVNDRIGIMNLITPNGDGYNDRWEIFHIEKRRPCAVNIYNRSGIEVFSDTNYINDWTGTINGKPLPEGTYYYILKCDKDADVIKGAISIIR
ncbi:MAG: gliding motility-associated C-terminal domain-containing protein [Bacteroidetes bacterium]|nr:gliding motility-associated C-terminal domain-containing protein [Bacteroidota bacterium]